jgi:hypothetical protein
MYRRSLIDRAAAVAGIGPAALREGLAAARLADLVGEISGQLAMPLSPREGVHTPKAPARRATLRESRECRD